MAEAVGKRWLQFFYVRVINLADGLGKKKNLGIKVF
jgi:hypothetical protein